jgi:hypothetical protein
MLQLKPTSLCALPRPCARQCPEFLNCLVCLLLHIYIHLSDVQVLRESVESVAEPLYPLASVSQARLTVFLA